MKTDFLIAPILGARYGAPKTGAGMVIQRFLVVAGLLLAALSAGLAQEPERGETRSLLEDLVQDLRSDDGYVRKLARDALATMPGEAVVRRMVQLLQDESPRRRGEAAAVLGGLGERANAAVPALRRALEDPDPLVCTQALRALASIRPQEPLPLSRVIEMLRSGRDDLVELGLRALVPMDHGGEKVAPAVAALIGRAQLRKETRLKAALTLAAMGGRAKAAEPALARLLREGLATEETAQDELTRQIARALCSVGAESVDAVAALAEFARRRARARGRLDAEDLRTLKGVAPRVLARVVSSPGLVPEDDPWLVQLAQVATARRGDPLVELARAGPVEHRLRALRLLAAMGPAARGALDVLVASTHDPAAKVRRAAADALGAIGRDAKAAVPALLSLLEDEASRTRFWAARALGSICGGGEDVLGLSTRLDRAKTLRRNDAVWMAIIRGLQWLADHQDVEEDGRWDSDDFEKNCPPDDKCGDGGGGLFDVGVTGLALLAFLGAGYTDNGATGKNSFARTVGQGLRYLMTSQAEDGVFGTRATHSFMYNHSIATLAMCEAYGLTHNPHYKKPAQDGLNFIAMARNPYMAWRYEPRGGENDTSVTGWCVSALKAGESAGLRVDPEAFAGARTWIDKMTDPNFGQVGYNYPGGASARPEGKQERFPPEKTQAMTAVGILSRIFLGEDPRASKVIRKGAMLCVKSPPAWNPENGSIDMYYWYYATAALFQVGGSEWRRWNQAMKKVLLASQKPTGSGGGAGSWDPVGAWGDDGGRVYATAMMVLTLETPVRHARLAAGRDAEDDPVLGRVCAALERASESDDAMLAEAATTALNRIRGDSGRARHRAIQWPLFKEATQSFEKWRRTYDALVRSGNWRMAWRVLERVLDRAFPFAATVVAIDGERVHARFPDGTVETLRVNDLGLRAAIHVGDRIVVAVIVTTQATDHKSLAQLRGEWALQLRFWRVK